jgi:hypothetical protein
MKSLVQFLGRRRTSGGNLIDKVVAVSDTYDQAGKMQVALLPGAYTGLRTIVGTSYVQLVSASSSEPKMITRLELNNVSGSDTDLRMAIMTVSGGSPSTSNAILAWDTTVLDGDTWRWTGQLPLVGRYFYVKVSVAWCTIYVEYHGLTEA